MPTPASPVLLTWTPPLQQLCYLKHVEARRNPALCVCAAAMWWLTLHIKHLNILWNADWGRAQWLQCYWLIEILQVKQDQKHLVMMSDNRLKKATLLIASLTAVTWKAWIHPRITFCSENRFIWMTLPYGISVQHPESIHVHPVWGFEFIQGQCHSSCFKSVTAFFIGLQVSQFKCCMNISESVNIRQHFQVFQGIARIL